MPQLWKGHEPGVPTDQCHHGQSLTRAASADPGSTELQHLGILVTTETVYYISQVSGAKAEDSLASERVF